MRGRGASKIRLVKDGKEGRGCLAGRSANTKTKADMEVNQPIQKPPAEVVVELVMRWSGLDPAHKIAWRQIWDLTGGKSRTVRIHCKLIGEYQGAEDPHRTGVRMLKALERHNLIFVHSKDGGLWTFF